MFSQKGVHQDLYLHFMLSIACQHAVTPAPILQEQDFETVTKSFWLLESPPVGPSLAMWTVMGYS